MDQFTCQIFFNGSLENKFHFSIYYSIPQSTTLFFVFYKQCNVFMIYVENLISGEYMLIAGISTPKCNKKYQLYKTLNEKSQTNTLSRRAKVIMVYKG